MNTATQITRRCQAIIEYSIKKGVSAAARRYNVSRQLIYRRKKRYDGTLESLKDRSHRPHSHPNQHTDEEIELIKRMRKKNKHAGLVVFWVKLKQRRIRHELIKPYTPRHNGKVERSHRKDNEYFYASHTFSRLTILKSN